MAAPKGTLIPRVEGSAEVYGKRLNNRARALLDSVFDLIEEDQRKGKFDPRVALRAAFERDPLGYLERVIKLTPEGAAGPVGGLITNIGAMYLQALQAPQAPVPVEVVDVTPAGYNAGTAEPKLLITQEDW